MRKFRFLAVMVAALLAVAMLAGCTGDTEPVNPSPTPETGGEVVEGSYILSEEPVELTIFMHMGAWGAMRDEWVIYGNEGGAAQYTNVSLKGTANTASTDAAQEYNLMMASEPLPDIIHSNKNNLNKAGVDDEAMIALDDLIDEFAPNIKKFLDENPWARAGSVASDGKLYYIPNSFQGIPSVGFFIRKDWLDKLDLEIPTTLDEYYTVLKAFREQDPNGNGEKDEIPFLDRNGSIDGLSQLWGLNTDYWGVDEDGKVYFGKVTPEYKVAITEIAKWYEEGLIDPEIFTRGQKSRDILFGDNRGGSTHDWFSSTGAFNHLSSQFEGFELIAIAPPADINGNVKEMYTRQALSGQGWGISVDCANPELAIKYLDFWFTKQGQLLYSYGIEGTDYVFEDGKPIPTEAVTNAPDGAPTYLRNRGQSEIGAQMMIDAELAVMKPQSKAGYEMYSDNNYCIQGFPKLSYTAEEEKILSAKSDALFSYVREKDQKWFMGQESVEDNWESFLAEIETFGLNELMEVQQAAYDRYAAELAR